MTRSDATPATSTTAAATATETSLFRDHVLKARPGKYRENTVVQGEEGQIATRVVAHGGADAADEDRKRQREKQHRKEQLPSAARGSHRGENRAHCADPDVGEGDRR